MRMTSSARRPRVLVATSKKASEQADQAEKERLGPMLQALRRSGLETVFFAIGSQDELVEAIKDYQPDLAYCTFFKFPETRDGLYAQPFFVRECVGWMGSGDLALEIALRKPDMKRVWREAGIPTPDWFEIGQLPDGTLRGIDKLDDADRFPYFVKPACEGNSRGIDERSVVRTPLELLTRVTALAAEFGEVLVERYIGDKSESREFTVAMIGNFPKVIVAGIEISKDGQGTRFITRDDKDRHITRIEPIKDPRLKDAVESLARRAFYTACVRDYARMDIMLDSEGLHAMELNGQAMIPDRWFEACAREAGLDSMQYLQAIALASMQRHSREGLVFIQPPLELLRGLPAAVRAKIAG